MMPACTSDLVSVYYCIFVYERMLGLLVSILAVICQLMSMAPLPLMSPRSESLRTRSTECSWWLSLFDPNNFSHLHAFKKYTK